MNRRGPLIAAGVGLVVILAMVGGLILPKAKAVRNKQAEVTQAEQEERSLRLTLEQLEAAAKNAKQTRKQLAQIEAQIPPTADLPGLILLLNTTAAQAGVDFTSMAPGQPAPGAGGKLSIVPMQITVIGRFFALDQYLFLLEGLPRVSKVLSLGLAAGPEGLPQLQGTLSVEFYTTDLSAGPGSVPGPTTSLGPAPAPSPSPGEEASPSPSPAGLVEGG